MPFVLIGRMSPGAIAERLRERGVTVLGVDFDPEVVRAWRRNGYQAIYGDATDPELVAALPLHRTRWAISSIASHAGGVTHDDHRLGLILALHSQRFGGKVAVTTHAPAESELLRARGADLVLLPYQDAAERAAEIIASPAQG